MITESLLKQIDEGRKGKNQGFSMGLPRLEAVMDGVMPSTYTLIYSLTSGGKTSFTIYSYIYRPLMDHLEDDDFYVIYYSLEISAEILMAKLLAIYIFEQFHIELSSKDILSRRKGFVLNDEYYDIIKECIPWLQKVEKHITIFDKGLNADVLYRTLLTELAKKGEFKEEENRKVFIPKKENQVILVVIDHVNLCQANNGRTLKQEIDLISTYLVTLRNRCHISPVVIMQANRNSMSMERRREGLGNLRLDDTKDSSTPTADSDIVLSLYSPFRDKIANHKGYDIRQLGDQCRSIFVQKNRYGESELEDFVAFYGRTGLFYELPKSDEIYDYSKYQTTDWLVHPDESNNENKIKFTL